MKYKLIILLAMNCLVSCKKDRYIVQDHTINKVLLLKVDFMTNNFQGGKEFIFREKSTSFTITTDYHNPNDLGYIKLKYQEINETLFDGTIEWTGTGKMIFPTKLDSSNQFSVVSTNDIIYPSSGFQSIFESYFTFSPLHVNSDYAPIWNSIQKLNKVREYMASSPSSTVKLYLYTPSVGLMNPAKAYWVIFLNN